MTAGWQNAGCATMVEAGWGREAGGLGHSHTWKEMPSLKPGPWPRWSLPGLMTAYKPQLDGGGASRHPRGPGCTLSYWVCLTRLESCSGLCWHSTAELRRALPGPSRHFSPQRRQWCCTLARWPPGSWDFFSSVILITYLSEYF